MTSKEPDKRVKDRAKADSCFAIYDEYGKKILETEPGGKVIFVDDEAFKKEEQKKE